MDFRIFFAIKTDKNSCEYLSMAKTDANSIKIKIREKIPLMQFQPDVCFNAIKMWLFSFKFEKNFFNITNRIRPEWFI